MKAIFFDRDGTLNIDPGYINNPNDMRLYPKTREALKKIKSLGYFIFIISNQSGIGRGKIRPNEYRNVCGKFLSLAGDYEIIDDILYCPHSPDMNCLCRKPETALVDIVKEQYKIDLKKSYFIGDKMSDIAVGKRAGLKTILILNGAMLKDVSLLSEYPNLNADIVVDRISEIIKIVK